MEPKQQSVSVDLKGISLIAAYWLRFFCSYDVQQVPKSVVQLTKISRTQQKSALLTLDIVPLIIEYARTPIDFPLDAKDEKLDIDNNAIHAGYDGLVIDLGSGSIKVGLGGEDQPAKIFPPAVAYDKHRNIVIGNDIQKCEAQNQTLYDKHYVIQRGLITNFDEMLQILQYILKGIEQDTRQNLGLLLIEGSTIDEHSDSCKQYVGKVAQMVYENQHKLNVYGLQMSTQHTLMLYACGHSTGLVINCGYGLTQIVSCFEGYAMPHCCKRIEFGKSDLMTKGIADNDEKCIDYMLNVLKLHELALQCLVKMTTDVQQIGTPIVIGGGNCLYKGFTQRFTTAFEAILEASTEAKQLGLNKANTKIVCAESQSSDICSWIGGSIIASLRTFQRNFATAKDYNTDREMFWMAHTP